MKRFINTIAGFSFIIQFFSCVLNVLSQRKASNVTDSLYNIFMSTAYVCSLFSVLIFLFYYNFDFKLLKKMYIKIISIAIVALGGYVYLFQLFVLQDFIFSSSILLFIAVLTIRKIIRFKKFDDAENIYKNMY